ncbi:unnamed protein product, partial [Ectocarpus sp. 8 AP-2014]
IFRQARPTPHAVALRSLLRGREDLYPGEADSAATTSNRLLANISHCCAALLGVATLQRTVRLEEVRHKHRHRPLASTTMAISSSSSFLGGSINRLRLCAPLLILLLITIWRVADARTFEASPDGVPYSIASALAEAGAGDTVVLADGTYNEAIVTVQGGESGNPLIITGGRGALVNAGEDGKVVYVQHSWVTLEGFSVDGKISDDDKAESYVDKCVFVEGPSTSGDERLEGFVMQDVSVQNCGDECVRLKSFVVGAVISDNVIQDCGVRDFVYGNDGKNGEGIYVGTSSTQWSDGPDECNDNTITGNTITPNGNECVDVKEGSTGTIVEGNTCSGQLDEDSGCFGSRGDGNVFR